MAAQGLAHQCDHPGAKSQQRLLWGLLAPLCPCANTPGQAGGQKQHPQHPVSVGGHRLPAQEWHPPHSSSFKTNRRKKREKERHEALPRALPKPQPCSPRGTPNTCTLPRTPALDQVQCSGAAVSREIFPRPGSNTSPPFWSLFLSISPYLCPTQLTCWHTPEFTPQSFLRMSSFFKAAPFWHQGS